LVPRECLGIGRTIGGVAFNWNRRAQVGCITVEITIAKVRRVLVHISATRAEVISILEHAHSRVGSSHGVVTVLASAADTIARIAGINLLSNRTKSVGSVTLDAFTGIGWVIFVAILTCYTARGIGVIHTSAIGQCVCISNCVSRFGRNSERNANRIAKID